jgi:hypothetical protein
VLVVGANGAPLTKESTMSTETKTTTLAQAIEQVLRAGRKPMTVTEVSTRAVPLAAGVRGSTPRQQVYSILYGEKKRPEPRWVLVARGTFKSTPKPKRSARAKVEAKS